MLPKRSATTHETYRNQLFTVVRRVVRSDPFHIKEFKVIRGLFLSVYMRPRSFRAKSPGQRRVVTILGSNVYIRAGMHQEFIQGKLNELNQSKLTPK